MNKSQLKHYFLLSGKVEGYSFLMLLMLAMPLKYLWEIPELVRIIGMAHGILFLVFCTFIYLCVKNKIFSSKIGAIAFLFSLVPFGTFFLNNLTKERNK